MQLITIGASSSTCVSVSPKKYDVFISFRGEDTRCKFTSHLYEALRKRVRTFIDNSELKKGDEISSALDKAIEGSYASIVIFSKDYASSKWCLNELVKILECKKEHGQIVIPIFYEVDPSHVRKQIGSYREAFAKHEQDLKHNKEILQKWKDALTEASNSTGWPYQNNKIESDFIKDIVKDVLKQLNHKHPFEVNKELVGIEKKSKEVEPWLNIGSNCGFRTLVLWGMGGIGKTTLAKNLYAKYLSQFEDHRFFENVRSVDGQIFKRKFPCGRSLIVFDNVATVEEAEHLNEVTNCLVPGSRVIVTTRDKKICNEFNECTIYKIEELNEDDSLQLFSQRAFREEHVKVEYEELLARAIGYCKGNPLALKVLGANLCSKSKEAWGSELEKIKEIPYAGIHDVLKLSFIDLDCTQRDIFLDIACFFQQNDPVYLYVSITQRDYMINVFHACKFHPDSAIEVLLDKALITFDIYNHIKMHDLLVEMGREIVRQESPKDPGRRSRLWDPEEVYDVLKYNKGTDAVEVILFHTSKIGDLSLSSKSFESMINLRFLHITNKANKVHLPEGLEWLSDKLSHLYWESFPLESLPSTFCPERLVQLSMPHSKLKKLWDGIQKLDNLMIIHLNSSKDLIEIPDLSRAPNLQILSLAWCSSLRQLHPSIFTAAKLKVINLRRCYNLEALPPDNIQNCLMLESLDIDECRNLKSLSKLPKSLQILLAVNCISLDTDSIQREMLENILYGHGLFSLLPGAAEVPSQFEFYSKNASIVLPPMSKYGLSYFVLCIILSEGLYFDHHGVQITIYEHGKEVHQYALPILLSEVLLDSNHVLLYRWSTIDSLKNESGGDHYNFSFEFHHQNTDSEPPEEGLWSNIGIKGCGVIPVYDRKVEIVELQSSGDDSDQDSKLEIHDLQHQAIEAEVGKDCEVFPECDLELVSRDEIVELQSSSQVFGESDQHLKFDIDELQHQTTIGVEVRDSTNENEDDQQEDDLKDKSSCHCSIGLLLKHLLEESKHLFLSVSQAKR